MNEADIKFLRNMIEHHTAALKMAKDYLDNTQPATRQARVADLARNIIKAQTAEIAMMQQWLPAGSSNPPSMM